MHTSVPFESNLLCRKYSAINTAQHHVLVIRHFEKSVLALTSLTIYITYQFALSHFQFNAIWLFHLHLFKSFFLTRISFPPSFFREATRASNKGWVYMRKHLPNSGNKIHADKHGWLLTQPLRKMAASATQAL